MGICSKSFNLPLLPEQRPRQKPGSKKEILISNFSWKEKRINLLSCIAADNSPWSQALKGMVKPRPLCSPSGSLYRRGCDPKWMLANAFARIS